MLNLLLKSLWSLALLATLGAGPASGVVVLGQIDDFQDGTLQGWRCCQGANPTNIATGGPAGMGDRYLEISSTNSPLGMVNDSGSSPATLQWTGDYMGEGVALLRMNLNNLGANPLSIRISIFSNGGSSYTSTNATVLPAASGWVSADFWLDGAALSLSSGAEALNDVLADVGALRLRHDPDPMDPPGTPQPVTGTLGIDNIAALPEPGGIAGVAAGGALLWGLQRRRRVS